MSLFRVSANACLILTSQLTTMLLQQPRGAFVASLAPPRMFVRGESGVFETSIAQDDHGACCCWPSVSGSMTPVLGVVSLVSAICARLCDDRVLMRPGFHLGFASSQSLSNLMAKLIVNPAQLPTGCPTLAPFVDAVPV